MPEPETKPSSTFYAGTSGWAYAAWKPQFYPAKLPAKDFLKFYSTQLNAVEVNYSFRRMINEKTIAAWVAQTPPHFRFVLKAHQAITHFRRLKNAEEPLQRFLECIQPLAAAGRLGPVLFQLPPNLKADLNLLNAFLDLLPGKLRAAFEFRETSWFSDDIYALLRRHNAALCIAENDDLQTPEVVTADFAYFRLRRSQYSAEDRTLISDAMRKRLKQAGEREIYSFFKHEEVPESPLYARELLESVSGMSNAA
ncbi:MAG TPA: DUF72 domain-containing protein [Terriglobales bacterium]|jgi:uncharacterized protein YecE (DUF72 family)|nr:DUF72 domain-containing protein [Terriglobales bacterium]